MIPPAAGIVPALSISVLLQSKSTNALQEVLNE